jgi:hypothetical protein
MNAAIALYNFERNRTMLIEFYEIFVPKGAVNQLSGQADRGRATLIFCLNYYP